MIKNVCVYGLDESIKASKYPMATDTEKCTSKITGTTMKLANCVTGTGHDNFLNGIVVQFDLTLTLKAWTEAQRYNFFHFVSSQSTMHRIAQFDLDKQYIEYVDPRMVEIMKELVDTYNRTQSADDYLRCLYSNPDGFRLTARMTTNYRQLKTIYQQRRTHRLPEWRDFCAWIETLPHAELIIGGVEQ